jgi:hypothetical protein
MRRSGFPGRFFIACIKNMKKPAGHCCPAGFRVCQGKVESGFPDKTNSNKEI